MWSEPNPSTLRACYHACPMHAPCTSHACSCTQHAWRDCAHVLLSAPCITLVNITLKFAKLNWCILHIFEVSSLASQNLLQDPIPQHKPLGKARVWGLCHAISKNMNLIRDPFITLYNVFISLETNTINQSTDQTFPKVWFVVWFVVWVQTFDRIPDNTVRPNTCVLS